MSNWPRASPPNSAVAKGKNLTTPHEKDYHEEVLIYPLDKAHLWYNHLEINKPAGGRITMVWLFGIIGVRPAARLHQLL